MVNSVDKNVQVIFESKRKKSSELEDIETKKLKIKYEGNDTEIVKKEVSHKKCSFCKRKLGIVTSYTCRCGDNFCSRHRFCDQHNCSFDFKSKAIEKLKKNNPKIVNRRIRE
ncbi:AN1-type zinc finger protein 6 [Nosema bombycis CQ1]|uniref:AN1-type zinc finger protein 6 n=1 Tax=Nosema bombycis (strain CQ1 / CVCC 102059) TaxID=578461 RepID=R0M1N6_NOSB1|nr:AN1-type zinc finger protein 6 [Nosema bombycis CQ1]|eukprot:EOB11914.1 AN1-type zinc finger protein 6 [Nosema bombycis CQ1]